MRFSLILLIGLFLPLVVRNAAAEVPDHLRDDRLVAWCIVPFDSQERSPAERAEMLERLGIRRVAYDWRAKHVPTFEEEILEYQQHGIEYFAFWGSHEKAFALFEKYDLHPQIWQTLGSPSADTESLRVKAAAEQMLPLVERTRTLGCKLGLYNHGGWGGEPENLVAVCRYLRRHHQAEHVGIVYNLHHGHGHIDDFAEVVKQMRPYLLCLNLNGMNRRGDERGQKILPLGEGECDVRLLTTLRDSGYDGPVGIIGHTQDDVEHRLRDNLDGLHWLLPQTEGKPAGPRPVWRTYSPEPERDDQSSKAFPGKLLEGNAAYRRPPITVECQVTLPDASGYNILVASETKASGDHWEIFTMPRTGEFTAYLPGHRPDHVRSQANLCDGKRHTVAMVYDSDRVRLIVDGKQVAEQAIERIRQDGVAGKLGIGRLVEGGLGCRGTIDWVRISRGDRTKPSDETNASAAEESPLLFWRANSGSPDSPVAANNSDAPAATGHSEGNAATDPGTSRSGAVPFQTPRFSAAVVARLLELADRGGDPGRGLIAFSDAKSACLSCHRIGKHGGDVGPELTDLAKQRKPEEIVSSILWPAHEVKPEYVAQLVIDDSGNTHQGYLVRQDNSDLVLRDPSAKPSREITIPLDEIELRREVGTLMPNNLAATMSETELVDLIEFMVSLGTDRAPDLAAIDSVLSHAQSHAHGPAEFPYDRKPLRPELAPSWEHHVNRDRVYDFYAKQADFFRKQASVPSLLTEYPGLDGGTLGHWGNQDDTVWADDRWNETDLGSLISGVFRGKTTVPRGVCVRLGEDGQLATCFNPETLTYEAVWRGGFVKFSDHRHGFLAGLRIDGTTLDEPAGTAPDKPFHYNGFYRVGKQVVFSYRLDGREILDAPVVRNGGFERVVAAADEHPMKERIQDPPPQWPQTFDTPISHGSGTPYVIDRIGLPFDNPWNALMFCGDHAFLPDGSALVCTMQGDVWRVSGFAYPSRKATWRRFASGLHHPLGMVVDDEGIFVQCRDQITRLHDLNGDGESDFYECFSRAFETSPAGHDFICGLGRDAAGNFYTASGNQGLVRISPDGAVAETIATGFRNPDGLGVLTDGSVTVPCSEGAWTPASMICAVKTDEATLGERSGEAIQHFGYRGPRGDRVPDLPLVYLPRGLDNSSGGQAVVSSDQWGPLGGQLIHFSFGTGNHFLVLRDEVNGQPQGAVVPLPGEFRSGAHRGKFHPVDGQLYVSGMQGWGSYTPDDGCFERVRYVGDSVQIPTGFRAHQNGIAVTFAERLDREVAAERASHFAQTWNYRYSSAYGSPEMSTRQFGMRGHDVLTIRSAQILEDGRTLFLEIPEIQPANQVHLRLQSARGAFHDLFVTAHELAAPMPHGTDPSATEKTIAPHPILADLAMATRSVPNPHVKKIRDARTVEIETGTNLSFKTRSFRVQANEPIALKLINPDVVPHNWALVKPGTLERVGRLADRLISDPEAALQHYVPATADVLVYTDVVLPRSEFTIYFRAPREPGRYPYLCTFPGHWKVMNGVMIVESDDRQKSRGQ